MVVEDERAIRDGLCDVLRFRGYEVEPVDNGTDAVQRALSQSFDLVLLDIMLPELDGLSVCRRVREAGNAVPVLMLTAKGSEEDILRGFEVGADDYVTKPFSVRELLARVQALLKRSGGLVTDTFTAGPLEVDVARGTTAVEGAQIALSAREIHILQLLCADPGRIVSRRVLLREAWAMPNADAVETRTVDVHVAKLRKKLGTHGGLIETVRGQGYRWSATP